MPTPAEPEFSPPSNNPGNQPTPNAPPGNAPASRPRGLTPVVLIILVALVIAGAWYWTKRSRAAKEPGAAGPGGRSVTTNPPVTVIAGTVEQKDVPIYLEGIGTVQAFNTVTVRSRVDGQVQRIAFVEGQEVHTGDMLAQIDTAP